MRRCYFLLLPVFLLTVNIAGAPQAEKPLTFVDFARTEGRFAKQFDKDGNPSVTLLQTEEDRLRNWRMLQELAGLR
jgi:pyruvate ferredoxin oxidoreductase beta subunit